MAYSIDNGACCAWRQVPGPASASQTAVDYTVAPSHRLEESRMIRPLRRKSRLWRAIGKSAAALGAIVVLAVALLGGLLWYSQPSADQAAAIAGLSVPVSITVDQDGVPRIRAASEIDAAAALGFLHARDRMFQLELVRRAASGRLSELVGPQTLPFDREMRVLGLGVRAAADAAALPA